MMHMERELLLIGSTCVDVVIPLERLPRTGDDLQPEKQTFTIGGTGWNACRAAMLTGAKPTFLSPVGHGPYGQQVEAAFRDYGLDILARPDGENGCCYCLVEADGERTFMCIRGAEYEMRPEWLNALSGDYALCYVCGMELQDDPTGGNILDWLEAHPKTQVFYAPGPRGILMDSARQERILARKPIVHLNEHEILALTGEETQEAGALALHKITGNIVIVTLGGKGCLCVDKDGTVLYAEGRKVKVADTIGAGDSHAGTMLGCLYKGMDLVEAMKLANAVAAEVVSKEGAQIPRDLNFMEV